MTHAERPVLAFIFALLAGRVLGPGPDRLPGPHAHGRTLAAGPWPCAPGPGWLVPGPRPGPLGTSATAAAASAPADGGVATGRAAAAPGPEDAHGGTGGPAEPGRAVAAQSAHSAAACRIAMGVTMAFMLIIMI